MKVYLDYFRSSGKWYSEGEYETEKTVLYEIWEEVALMENVRRLPGLVEGHGAYYVTINVPEHPHNHPHLILPSF